MEQYTDSQYDDDLTIGTDDYDDTFPTNDIDLFEFGGDEDSVISRLKSLVLSIDWEITDEVLLQFNEELQDLKDVWANEKIRMVYLQALEKIGKYIYREKANAHPNAIRLLLSMYYNLERIVLSEELSDQEKKKILLEDVRRFEKLKKVIGKEPKVAEPIAAVAEPIMVKDQESDAGELIDLKAIVLGIDWEITEDDLLALREEVSRLEEVYSDSKPKLVFLQGIGTLGSYIRKKKSNAHADAFKILHSFYEGLEKLVQTPQLTLEEEKEILRPEVKKFNALKAIIAETLSKGEVDEGEAEEEEEDLEYSGSGPITPAFADLPEEGTCGFQEEVEAQSLNTTSPLNVDDHLDRFFSEGPAQTMAETEAPMSSGADTMAREAEEFSEAFFTSDEAQEPTGYDVDRKTALQGVDVETEADDDSDEEALPVLEGEVAPALVDSSDTSAFASADLQEDVHQEGALAEELSDRLDSFFETEEESGASAEVATPTFEVPADIALQGVDVETEADEEDEDEEIPLVVAAPSNTEGVEGDAIAPAFAEMDEAVQEKEESPAGLEWEEPIAAAEEEIPAALFAVDEAAEIDKEPGEEAVEQRFDELFAAMPADISEPEDATVEDEVEAFFSLEEESEVAEEPESASAQEAAPYFDLVEEPTVTAEEEVVPAEEEIVEGGTFGMEAVAEEPGAAPVIELEEEAVFVPEKAISEEGVPAGGVLADLRGCVQSIGIEVDDAILQGLSAEVANLRTQWADRPLEQTFLQLMSTVIQHIDRYRYSASDESNALLISLMDNLEAAESAENRSAQELLLASTGKVLEWQQSMVERQSIRDADGLLAFVDVSRVKVDEEVLTFEEEPTGMAAETEQQPETAAEETIELDLQEAMAEEVVPVPKFKPIDVSEGDVSEIIRREIDSLRNTLKKEIADLRKAMNMEDR